MPARFALALAFLLVACSSGPVTRTMPNGAQITVVDADCAERIQPLYDVLRDLDAVGPVVVGLDVLVQRTGCDVDADALPSMRLAWSNASRLIDEVALALP